MARLGREAGTGPRQQHAPSPEGAVTLRAVLAGLLMALFIGLATPYTNMIIKGSLLAHNANTPIALFTFFLFVGVLNVALRLARRSWVFDPGELATVYIMAMLATAVPTVGFAEYLLPIIAGVHYYATPENQWAEIVHPHLPRWLIPQSEEASRGFYEGLPEGKPVPWELWVEPLIAWSILILAVFWVSACLMTILRKQWMEHEKLLYPLVQVAIEMLRDDERRSAVKPFFRNPVMWAGFALPLIVGSIHSLHFYFPAIPGMGNWTTRLAMFRGTTDLLVMFNIGVVGIAYLLNRDVALGLWVFFLLAHAERGLFNILGIESTEKLSRFTFEGGPFLAHQTMGAMIVLVLSGLWMARDHLKRVWRRAFAGGDEEDAGEVMSYRTAVLGLLIGLAVVSTWLWASGLPWWVVPVFLFAVFIIFMALTRATVEGGMPHIRTPLTPGDFVVSGVGTHALGVSGGIALGFTYVWAANLRIFFMICFANSLRIAGEIRGSKRPLVGAAALAAAAALAGSVYSIVTLAYTHGGINLQEFYFVYVPQQVGKNMAIALTNPTFPSVSGWLFTAFGAAVMGLLTWVRVRFTWWPIHPLGFAVTEYRLMSFVWFSVLVAWGIKSLVLRYGGPKLYNRTRPFFLGLICGQICVTGFWLIVDFFTGAQGNLPLPWHSSFV